MIGQMAVRVTADRANFPLGTLFVRRGSAKRDHARFGFFVF